MKIIAEKKRLVALVTVVAVMASGMCAQGSRKSRLKANLNSVDQKIKNVQQKIHQKNIEKKDVLSELTATENRLETSQTSLSKNKIKLLDAQNDLAATVQRLDIKTHQLKRHQELLARRVVDIYEGEDVDYANVVLGSNDMGTFLTRSYYLKRILATDAKLIDGIEADKAQIERDRARQTARVDEIGTLMVQLEAERDEISELADVKRQEINTIENSKDLYEQALDKLEADSRRIEEQIRRIQSTPRGRMRYAKAFHGGLCLPCYGRITSPFGYRVHPVTHVYKLHTGVDISVRSGTPVHAAANGVVILAGWMGAYGNAVIIDHGGGVSTLYGHNTRCVAHVGQQVKQGQVIAISGSTGYSTGPHCHFEKRLNGRPVNPL